MRRSGGRVRRQRRRSAPDEVFAEEAHIQRPLQIRFHQVESSPAIVSRIGEKAAELERFSDRITSCRVTVEKEHGHHRKGNLFRVCLDTGLPGMEIP